VNWDLVCVLLKFVGSVRGRNSLLWLPVSRVRDEQQDYELDEGLVEKHWECKKKLGEPAYGLEVVVALAALRFPSI